MIAYVFWHWKKPATPAHEYESRQRAFHAALAASPPAGFIRSFSAGFAGAPWTASKEAYEDWYLVEDFSALASLNEGAVSGSRSVPHDAAAAGAVDGTGSIYALRWGRALSNPRASFWFGKPAGMSYGECFKRVEPVVENARGALWMRQLALGPAREFCLQAEGPVTLPPGFEAFRVPLRQVWPSP